MCDNSFSLCKTPTKAILHSVIVLSSFKANVGNGSAPDKMKPYFGKSCLSISSLIVFEATEVEFLAL